MHHRRSKRQGTSLPHITEDCDVVSSRDTCVRVRCKVRSGYLFGFCEFGAEVVEVESGCDGVETTP